MLKGKKGINLIFLILIAVAVIVVGSISIVLVMKKDNNNVTNTNYNLNNSNIDNSIVGNENDNNNLNNTTSDIKQDANTTNDENNNFLFEVETIFEVTGRGTIVNGIVQRGKVKVGDTVQIVGKDKEIITTEVKYIQKSSKMIDEATVGDSVGIWLKDITSEQIEKGQILKK